MTVWICRSCSSVSICLLRLSANSSIFALTVVAGRGHDPSRLFSHKSAHHDSEVPRLMLICLRWWWCRQLCGRQAHIGRGIAGIGLCSAVADELLLVVGDIHATGAMGSTTCSNSVGKLRCVRGSSPSDVRLVNVLGLSIFFLTGALGPAVMLATPSRANAAFVGVAPLTTRLSGSLQSNSWTRLLGMLGAHQTRSSCILPHLTSILPSCSLNR